MVDEKIIGRIEFLAKKFDIFESDEISIGEKIEKFKKNNIEYLIYKNQADTILAIISIDKRGEKERVIKNVSVSINVFSDIIAADPTPNKSCVQWMLTIFTKFLTLNETPIAIELANRFVFEDLPQANTYLKLFEAHKRKNKFKKFCTHSYILKDISDPTDINQYKSLSQLFDAVDPFIERDATEMESLLYKYIDINQAKIPVRDRKFTLYIPKTTDANLPFNNFANWCTAKPNNGMFDKYTNNLRPDGQKSDIYIIINNKFFTGESNELYQIHFQTNQIKDRHNSQNVSIFESVLNQSESILNFFKEELTKMAKDSNCGLENNKYLDFLIQFGFCETLFEFIDSNSPTIRFMERQIPKLPDLSKFKELDQLIITNANLVELHPSIGNLVNLEMLVLTDNRIKSLPKEIGGLKKLTFMNLIGNPITEIPNEIAYLDKSNGGSLFRLAIDAKDIGEENYKKLILLLPTTNIGSNKK